MQASFYRRGAGSDREKGDRAEDRRRFSRLLNRLEIPQPESATARSPEEALESAKDLGYPILVRPSYVLGGRAMVIVYDKDHLESYIREAVEASPEQVFPLLCPVREYDWIAVWQCEMGTGEMVPYLEEIAAGLKEENFEGVVSLESVYHPDGGTYEDGFRASVGRFKEIFG